MNKYIKTDKHLTCFLSGRIDTLNSDEIENEVYQNMNEDSTSLILDMQEVTYISSTFLRIVIKFVKSLGRENFAIINVQPSVMLVFKISGLSEVIKS